MSTVNESHQYETWTTGLNVIWNPEYADNSPLRVRDGFDSDSWKKATDTPRPANKPRHSKQYRRMVKQRRKQGRVKK